MRVLLTGARGFIGRRCIAPLRQRGFEVHAVSSQPHLGEQGVTWHTCDLLDAVAVRALVQAVQPTHLLHLAWVTTPGQYWNSPLNEAWQQVGIMLIDAFIASGGRRAVFAGSGAEYDWAATGGVCDEFMTPLNPASLYGRSKVALWRHVEAAAVKHDVTAAWGRVFWCYGPGEPDERMVPSTILRLLRGETAPCSIGTQRRDYIYVSDVAEAFAALLASSVTGPVNLGRGEAVAVGDVARAIGEIIGRPELINLGALPASGPPLVVARTERLRREVGFEPRVTLRNGLSRFVEHLRETAGCLR